MIVGEATAPKWTAWEVEVTHGLKEPVIDNRKQAFDNGHFVLLVNYRNPDEWAVQRLGYGRMHGHVELDVVS